MAKVNKTPVNYRTLCIGGPSRCAQRHREDGNVREVILTRRTGRDELFDPACFRGAMTET